MPPQNRVPKRGMVIRSPAYWDNLSQPRLSKNALTELRRRLGHAQPNPSRPSGSAAAYLHKCPPAKLKLIKRFSRQGGPDLSDLGNYPPPDDFREWSIDPTIYDHQEKQDGKETVATATSVCSFNFEDHLVDHQIYPPGYWYPDGRQMTRPDNLKEIRRRLAAPRPSIADISEKDFKKFAATYWTTHPENKVKASVISALETKSSQYAGRRRRFTNLAPLTDGTIFVQGEPDICHGARLGQLDPQVCKELSKQIVPATEADDVPVAPNFFLIVRGAEASSIDAERQACYYGALGSRAINALHSYRKDKPVYDNNAYTIIATYSCGVLEIYATHIVECRRGTRGGLEYLMTRLGAWPMHGNLETFQQGVIAYRNARDWAKEMRDEAIKLVGARG
ncbi:hypothetical protein BDW59DRAFT_164100 [Aspergillus cavernicola]|uniref:Uncharacterized protein n=1 Tax=Aspergillus cavernicola TaxID=176166 RepID=A0ABR4I2A4_9EURO